MCDDMMEEDEVLEKGGRELVGWKVVPVCKGVEESEGEDGMGEGEGLAAPPAYEKCVEEEIELGEK